MTLPGLPLAFLNPFQLLWLLAVPLLWLPLHALTDYRHGIIRTVLALCLVVALARPVWLTEDSRTWRVFVVDRSASVSREQLQQGEKALSALLAQAPVGDPLSIIFFGGAPPAGVIDHRFQVLHILRSESPSSLGTALGLAARQIPQGGSGAIAVIGQSLSTDRQWGAAVQELIAREIAVSTVDLGPRPGDAYPASLEVEAGARVGETVEARVEVVGAKPGMRVSIRGAQGELARSAVLRTGGRVSVSLRFELPKTQYLRLTAELLPGVAGDTDLTNNRVETTIAVQDPIKVSYLGERERGGAQRLSQLLGPGFDVGDASILPRDDAIEASDLVFLDDRPARLLSPAMQLRLLEGVRDHGLGLFFSGGRSSFGPGGYYLTVLANALPVDFSQRDAKHDPSASLAIIMDTSGSMYGLGMDLAKQVAVLAVRRLQAQDRIGIVEFFGGMHWSVPMQPASDKAGVESVIDRMQARGGTGLYGSMEEAYFALRNQRTRFKHILLITDGDLEDEDYEGMIRRITRDGINLSTVLVGQNAASESHNAEMFQLATWGKGSFYSVGSPYTVVEPILHQPSTEKMPAYHSGRFELVSSGGVGWWGEVHRDSLPPIDGYVETRPRPGAEVLLQERHRLDPILTSWQYGLGRVTTLATEPLGPGTQSWHAWREYGAMLGRVLSRTASQRRTFDYSLERVNDRITLTAVRASTDVGTRPYATLSNTLNEHDLDFRQSAPGLYEVSFEFPAAEDARIIAGGGADRLERLVSPARADLFPETQVDPARSLDLDRLARATHGQRLLASRPRMPDQDLMTTQGSLSLILLWPWLLLAGLLCYLGELLYRRRPRS